MFGSGQSGRASKWVKVKLVNRVAGQTGLTRFAMSRHNVRGCKASITSEIPWQRRDRLAKSKAVSIFML